METWEEFVKACKYCLKNVAFNGADNPLARQCKMALENIIDLNYIYKKLFEAHKKRYFVDLANFCSKTNSALTGQALTILSRHLARIFL